jgi:hypothetical protein
VVVFDNPGTEGVLSLDAQVDVGNIQVYQVES